MIEIERKCYLEPRHIAGIRKLGKLLFRSTFTDVYYDTKDYSYTRQNIWLRKRDGVYELKRRLKTEVYEEITQMEEIEKIVDLEKVHPFATFATTRERYKLFNVTVDLDLTDFGHEVGEIEILVEKESEVPKAEKKLDSMLAQFGIDSTKKPQKKIAAYLERESSAHYHILKNLGVI
ncbi:MAG: CYTH domain-containing protein [Chlamydiales bacterium]